MRYMFLVLMAPEQVESPPPQRLMDEMAKLTEKRTADGSMIGTGGLFPPAMGGARIALKGGKVKVTDGPFAETKEVIGGYAIFDFASREEALASAVEFMELHRLYGEGWEGVCELRELMMGADGQPDCSLAHEKA
ncbi:MAG: YciI family protein [Hyphomonadaceae bacterium]